MFWLARDAERLFGIQRFRREFVKPAARRIYIDERQRARVRAVGQKYENSSLFRLNPKRRSGKTEMSETRFR